MTLFSPLGREGHPRRNPTFPRKKGTFRLPEPEQLSEDSRLSQVELLLEDQVYGPESIAVEHSSGRIFVALKTGLICEVNEPS